MPTWRQAITKIVLKAALLSVLCIIPTIADAKDAIGYEWYCPDSGSCTCEPTPDGEFDTTDLITVFQAGEYAELERELAARGYADFEIDRTLTLVEAYMILARGNTLRTSFADFLRASGLSVEEVILVTAESPL